MNETIDPARESEPSARTGLPERATLQERAAAIGPSVLAWLLPFLLIVYLALRGGGYDAVVSGVVGVVIWWLVALGALVGIVSLADLRRGAWIVLGLLAAFAAWLAA